MPVISRFLGIIIVMYWNDHNPPHLHAKYNEYEALVDLSGNVLEGQLPTRTLKLVREWVTMHAQELKDNWHRAQHGEPLLPIEPLE